MVANLFLLLAAGTLVAAGVYLLLDRAMTKMIMGLMLIGNGANLLILVAGGPAGAPPIKGRESTLYPDQIADPLSGHDPYRHRDLHGDDRLHAVTGLPPVPLPHRGLHSG